MHPVLDHIVLLVPYKTLQNLPTWLTDTFTILNGGAHAGGETENKLIIFQDGTYIELIAFVDGLDPEKRAKHRWGGRSEGRIIDWALSLLGDAGGSTTTQNEETASGDAEVEFQKVQQRIRDANVGIEYEDPVSGGRTTPAGTVLKWATSSPVLVVESAGTGGDGNFSGGELPFWCLDRTPRSWRVPYLDEGNVNHPSQVIGIAGVAVLFRDGRLFEKVVGVYDAIRGFGSGSDESTDVKKKNKKKEWKFQVPVSSGGRGWTLQLSTFSGEEQLEESEPKSTPAVPVPDVLSSTITLTFWTRGEPRRIRGTIVDGLEIVFDLINH